MIYNFMEDNYYTEIITPDEGYVTRTQIKENKMTRFEALEKCGFLYNSKDVIGVLEALGLIKFEEKKSMKDVIINARKEANDYDDFVRILHRDGYRIVSK